MKVKVFFKNNTFVNFFTKLCQKNAKNFPGYHCIDEYWNCADCVCMYIEELSIDIGGVDQKKGRRMITEECTSKMTESTEYPCHDALCKGNDFYVVLRNKNWAKILDLTTENKVTVGRKRIVRSMQRNSRAILV